MNDYESLAEAMKDDDEFEHVEVRDTGVLVVTDSVDLLMSYIRENARFNPAISAVDFQTYEVFSR